MLVFKSCLGKLVCEDGCVKGQLERWSAFDASVSLSICDFVLALFVGVYRYKPYKNLE